MKKSEFLKEMHEMLEISSVESLFEETALRELAEYSSLSVLTIIALIDDNFNVQLSSEQLASVTTIKSLMELVGLEMFED